MTAMNLGDSHLRFVNSECLHDRGRSRSLYNITDHICTASRPQLVHTNSKQSVTASDDYYSLKSLTSEGSSNDDRAAAPRYETPPMHGHPANQDAQQPEATIPKIEPLRPRETYHAGPDAGASSNQHAVKRKPVSTSSSEGTIVRRPISTVSPPTPGVDDTPYIQFAIDQLTRDEEVVGSRHQSNGTEIPYPVERIIPNQYRDRAIPQAPPIPPSDSPRPFSESIGPCY